MGARGHGRYARGDNAVAICERCGVKTLRRYLVYDGQYPDLLVCSECWDPKHPQEYLPDVSDPVTIYDPTGDPDKQQANILTVDFNPAGGARSVDPLSAIPPYAASQVTPPLDNVTTNPLEVQLTVGASQYSLVVGQDPAVDGFPGGGGSIPLPQGNVLAASRTTSLEKPILLFSEDDQDTWLDTDFDAVGGATQIGHIVDVQWDPNNSQWVALGRNISNLGLDLWTCPDASITALSQWTQRTEPAGLDTITFNSFQWANGVGIAVGDGRTSPNRLTIIRTTDGITWTDVSPTASINNSLYAQPKHRKGNEWWTGGGNGQIARSLDNGLTWTTSGFGLPASGGNVWGIEFVDLNTPGDRGRIILYAYTASATTGIYYSDNDGVSWTPAFTAVGGNNSGAMAVNPNTGTVIHVCNNGVTYRIHSQIIGGMTVDVLSPFSGITPNDMIFQDNAEAAYGFVVVGQINSNGEGTVLNSTDDGLTWVQRVTDTSFDAPMAAIGSADQYKHGNGKNFGVP